MLKKLIRQMLFVQILSAMTVTICLLIDSIMIGRFLGVEAMSAYGYASPVILIFSAASTMIGAGSQVLCGRTMGAGDRKGTNACFTAAVMAVILMSIAGMAIVFVFSDPLCVMLGAGENVPDNQIFAMAKEYLRGFVLGAPFFMAQQVLVPYMQMAGNRKRLTLAVCAMSIGDILFDLLNIYVFKLGIFGMGLASALSYFAAILFAVSFFLKKDCLFQFVPSLIGIRVFVDLFKEGAPVLVNQVCLVLLPLIRNHLLTLYGGSLAVAAYSVISSVGSTMFSISTAVNSVSLTLSSIFYADKDKRSLEEAIKVILTYAVGIYLFLDIVILVAAEPIVMMFINDVSAVGMAVAGIRLVVISYIPCVLNSALKNYYQGIGHTKLTMAICAMQNLLMTSVSALVLGHFFGTTGIWISIASGEILTFLFIVTYTGIKNKGVSLRLENLLLLSHMEGVNDDALFSCSVRKKEDVVTVSEAASAFCADRGLENKTGMFIALAIEEMANNIITYGFTDGKAHSIDIRIVIGDGTTMLRIRDDCRNFDPIKYLELHEGDDPFSHIGIKMVMKLVKDARYEQTLGLNNLVLAI